MTPMHEYSHRRGHLGSGEAPPPLLPDVPQFDCASGPELSAETVDDFLKWAGAVPVAEVEVIRERIAHARDDDRLLERLTKELWALPIRDVSRHRLLLSTLGELKNLQAVHTLVKFIWHEGVLVARDDRERHRQPCSFEADGGEMVRARAAEMLSHLGSHEAIDATLDIAARHPSAFVRAAAIDAHMFNAGDSPKAAERLRKCVRPDDLWRVGLPRMTQDMDPEKFEKAVLAFYEQYPEEQPPAPIHHRPPGPDARSWYAPRREREA